MKLYLQNIVDTIRIENLPVQWLNFDFAKFSDRKSLYDYQQKALKNALIALYKYYADFKANKQEFYNFYQNNGFYENLDIKINGNKKIKIFDDFDNDIVQVDNVIPFYNFINRMSFWMATGSGKTLVIVKLIEMLANLIHNGNIPSKEILFLTYREDLLDQFKHHIDEFNSYDNSFHINLYNLKDYDKVKKFNRFKFDNEIDVFYYRSDLISNEQKDKIIDFRNYDNFGNWYILLDEAHKGDREESKRQSYYSILACNGFLFNFSATFTDAIDYVTCVYNFNLEQFITNGYGKRIYISQSNVTALQKNNEFTHAQKQIIILKILLLHTLIKINKPDGFYHNPLILTLVNSVNTEESDLELFFKEISQIAENGIDSLLFSNAKHELNEDLKHKYEFENEKLLFNSGLIDRIKFKDILNNVFNSDATGKIEVLKIPGNKQELIFKLTTSEKPFALIKIGDISEWLKNKLSRYQIIEKFDNESIFKQINENDSDINLLMGSRSFYEGWDSNRPNIILYINIGKGSDAKKFVLQSLGRGVRIETLPSKRRRLQFLYNNGEIDREIYRKIKDDVNFIETLFVYGTKADNIKEVMETLKQEKEDVEFIGDLFEINPDVKDKILLIPTYRDSDKIMADQKQIIKYEITYQDLMLLENYYNYLGDKVALIKYDVEPKLLRKINSTFRNHDIYYKYIHDVNSIYKPNLLFKAVISHLSLKSKEFKEFKNLEDEIIHFKFIKVTEKKRQEIEEKIKKVLSYKNREIMLAEIAQKLQNEPAKAMIYAKEIASISENFVKEVELNYESNNVKIKYIPNHYYLPVALTNNDKETYLMHIINTKSEYDFILSLENYLQKENNLFMQFDWWYFSKVDEILDEVFIPYYQPKTNKIEKFKPDFIFWLKKGNDYTILFVDPKGTEHTDAERKIDGYSELFERLLDDKLVCKEHIYQGYNVKVKLLLKTDDIVKVTSNYKKYWFDEVAMMLETL